MILAVFYRYLCSNEEGLHGIQTLTSAMPVQCPSMQLSYQANWELVVTAYVAIKKKLRGSPAVQIHGFHVSCIDTVVDLGILTTASFQVYMVAFLRTFSSKIELIG